jgi:hypothetical protein
VFTIHYDTVVNSKHAIDYLGSFRRDRDDGRPHAGSRQHERPVQRRRRGMQPGRTERLGTHRPRDAGELRQLERHVHGISDRGSIKIWGNNSPALIDVAYVVQNVNDGGNNCHNHRRDHVHDGR